MNAPPIELYNFDEDTLMKKRTLLFSLIFVVLLLVIGVLMVLYLTERAAKQLPLYTHEQISVAYVGNSFHQSEYIFDAQLVPERTVTVAFEVSGKLEKGEVDLETGGSFKKGQLLFQINNREAFAALNKEKAALLTMVLQLLPEIERDFPTEKNKWTRFMEELKPQFLVPEFPKCATSKERYLITEKGILTAYYALQHSEVNMSNYFYIAPFDGIWLSFTEQPGNIVRTGKRLATIATNGPLKLAASIDADRISLFDTKSLILVCNELGDSIGNATFQKRTNVLKSQTNSMVYYFTLNANRRVYTGMKVQLVTQHVGTQKNCWIPVTAMDKNTIQILRKDQLISKTIEIVEQKKDSVLVVGLQDGEAYSTHYQHQSQPDTRYYK